VQIDVGISNAWMLQRFEGGEIISDSGGVSRRSHEGTCDGHR
jgi:hypothetical protein